MRFYRLEKTNYFKYWSFAVLRAIAYALFAVIAIMLLAGYKFMIVSSGSMEPTLPVGSLVIVTPCQYEDLNEGDIVTMDAGGINLTHRIIGKYDSETSKGYLALEDCDTQEELDRYNSEKYWVTKGDNSDTVDGKLTKTIVGKVYDSHAFGWVGTIVRYVRANFTLLIVVLILIGVFVTILEWLKNKMLPDDIECYDLEDEE